MFSNIYELSTFHNHVFYFGYFHFKIPSTWLRGSFTFKIINYVIFKKNLNL